MPPAALALEPFADRVQTPQTAQPVLIANHAMQANGAHGFPPLTAPVRRRVWGGPMAVAACFVMDWRPDRLGHMCYLTDDLKKQLLESRIPVELCLTSNLVTESVPCLPDHHFSEFHTTHGERWCTCTNHW